MRRGVMYWFWGLDCCCRYSKTINEILKPIPKPSWTTPNNVELELQNVILRNFSVGKEDSAVLIVPPQAGHHSSIADYDKGQSLVEAALQSGIKSVYVMEWKSATLDQRNQTIDDSIISMRKCIEAIGTRVTLIGLCQGGWQSTIYTALYPEDVENLVLAGAPIDFHAGDGKISMYASLFPMSFYESMVAAGNGVLDGRFLLTGFKMLNPVDRYFGEYADLFWNVNSEAYLKRYRKFRDWYEYTQNLPGAFYLQVVKDLFKENKLIKGEVRVLGQEVDLFRINHPLFLIAGDKDEITLIDQLFNMERYVSSKSIIKLTVPAGHIGVFMGRKIIGEYWPGIFNAIQITEEPDHAPHPVMDRDMMNGALSHAS
jgi:poly(3-hydroxyalkanoate) synthetase